MLIKLTGASNGVMLYVNAEAVSAITLRCDGLGGIAEGCALYILSSDTPFHVKESVETVVGMIEEAQRKAKEDT